MSVTKSGLALAKRGLGAVTVGGGSVGFGIDMVSNLAAGDDLGTSTLKASVTGVLTASNPVLFTTAMGAKFAGDAYWGYQNWKYKKDQWYQKQYTYNNRVGGNYHDTQRAQTMRQAAIQAIQGSKLNARSALGGEAKILNPYSSRY